MKLSEKERLDKVSKLYSAKKSFDKFLIEFGSRKILSNAKGPDVLELGSADGLMTEILSRKFKSVHVVEASRRYIKMVDNKNLQNVKVFKSLFEDFESRIKYNDIIMTRVLEHVSSPVRILKKANRWLKPNGRIHIVVPNADSLNRRIGQAMHIIKNRTDLDDHDIQVGHRRVYIRSTLARDIKAANLKTIIRTGIFLKPLSNAQMLKWPKKIIDALYIVGNDFPELCSEIYFVATKKSSLSIQRNNVPHST